MAMPPETPMPCSEKLTVLLRSRWKSGPPAHRWLPPRRRRRFPGDGAALGGGQHHHAHDALGIDPTAVARHEYTALEAGGQLGQPGRWARVQPQHEDDINVPLLHGTWSRKYG